MALTTLQTAQIIRCPECYRKLCKIRDFTYPAGKFIEFKHKGATVITSDAIIECCDCKKSFRVTNDNVIKEIEIGR